MKNAVVWIAVLSWLSPLPVVAADTPKDAPTGAQESRISPLLEALEMRELLAAAILEGREDPKSALESLRAHPSPTGLGLAPDTEYAFAMVDLGRRLSAKGALAGAEAIFRESEKAIEAALDALAKEKAHERVVILRQRALVRSRHLGKGTEAKADFDEAIRLLPENKAIIRQRDISLSRYGELNRAPTPANN